MMKSEILLRASIYASTITGLLFVVVAWGFVPYWLYYSILSGFVLYVVASFLTLIRPKISYLLAFALSLITLASSLPQSQHYSFISQGEVLFSLIFILGDFFQFMIIASSLYMLASSRKSG